MKRFISLFLCVVMCVSVFSATATRVFALGKAEDIFTVEKTEFENDRITYTISLAPNQKKITGAIIKAEFDSAVLDVSGESGPVCSINDQGESAANIAGYYEEGITYNDENVYSVGYMSPNGFTTGDKSTEFIKVAFEVIGEKRPVTEVKFYCDEYITDDEVDNDIKKGDEENPFYTHAFLTLNPAKNVTVESCAEGLKFMWTPGEGADKYNIYRKATAEGEWQYQGTVPAGTSEYIDSTIDTGIEYYYSVETENEYGDKIEYDKTGVAGFSFGTITGIEVTPTERGALVTWAALEGAESYSVHRNEVGENDEDGNPIWKEVGETKVGETENPTSWEDEPLTSGVQYVYTVKAHRGIYNAEASVAPESITFIANGKIVGCQLNRENVVINWQTVTGAVSYEIYRKAEGESQFTKIGGTDYNGFEDFDVEDGKIYYYQICSVDENGNRSILGNKGYKLIKLPVPTGVKAEMSEESITVSWNAADPAEEYVVYRKTSTGNWQERATIPATQTKFEDKDVSGGITYIYAVMSKAEGLTTELSDVSDPVYFLKAPVVIGVLSNSISLEVKFNAVDGAKKYNIYRREVDGQFGEPIAEVAQTGASEYTYVDGSITSGVQYVYGVQSVSDDVTSAIKETSLACCLKEPQYDVEAVYEGVKLSWNEIEGAEGYAVYHSTTRKATKMTLLATVKDTSYIHTTPENGRNNYYKVVAVCGDTVSTATQKEIYYLAAPSDVKLKNRKSYVELEWSKNPDATEYEVYRKLSGASEWIKLDTEDLDFDEEDRKVDGELITYIICKDKSVSAGKTYVYSIASSDGEDFGGKNESGWKIKFLKSPSLKTVTNEKGYVKVTWNKASGASEYKIYRRTKSSDWKYLASTKSTSYSDKSVKSGTKYYYAVKSVSGSYTSLHSDSYFDDTCKTTTYLAMPSVKVANNTSTSITVSWSKIKGAEKYEVYRKAGSAKKWTKVKTTSSTSYTDKKVKNGTTYKYMVKAIDGKIVSAYNSSGVSIKRLAAPTPSSVRSTKSGITFKWGKVTGASGYIVYRKTGSGSYKELATVKGSTKVSYLDKSAKKGKTYTYIVKAYSGSSKSANKTGLKIKDKY